MEQKNLAKWLKCILIGVGICGLVIFGMIIPGLGISLRTQYPEFSNRFWPWLGFLWLTGLPCYVALVFAWKIVSNIGRDKPFSEANVRLLKWISVLASGDAGFFFVGNILLLLLNMSHPGITLASFLVVFAGAAIGVVFAVLSHLVKRASVLQEQSDWTI